MLACNICGNLFNFSCVKIDEDYLECMPVFDCPKCFKESSFTFPSYALKKYIENGELNLANVQKEFCKEISLEEFRRGIKCYSRRGINNNYNNFYANASF